MTRAAKPVAYDLALKVKATLIPHRADRKWLSAVTVTREGEDGVTIYREELDEEHVGPASYEPANAVWRRVVKLLKELPTLN